MRTLLTIAGTDPTSAAGIQIDLQVFRDYGEHGASAITAVVWQNTIGVEGYRALEADEVVAQLDVVLDDLVIDFVKVGMVPTAAQVEAIIDRVGHLTIVWDPVQSSGSQKKALVEPGAIDALRGGWSSLALLTPNVLEAERFTGVKIRSRDDAHFAAARLVEQGVPAVLLTTGHLPGDEGRLRDVLATGDGVVDLDPLPRVPTDVRGTGCQLSSAVTCELARGASIREACESARRYLNEKLRTSRRSVGHGRDVVVYG